MISQSSELGLECSRLVKIPQKIAVPNYFIFFDEDLESDLHMNAMCFTSLTDKDLIKYDWTSCSFSPSLNIQIYIKLKSLLEHFQSCFTLKDKVGLNVFLSVLLILRTKIYVYIKQIFVCVHHCPLSCVCMFCFFSLLRHS